MGKIILYIASSADGFIAREDGRVDWLPEINNEDYGYKEFYHSVDTLLMGKKTYDQILTFGKWPYEGKKCYVFSRSNAENNDKVNFASNPVSLTQSLKSNKNIWLVGGSQIISLLLKSNLIDEIILTILPIILGKGIPLFRDINKEIKINLIKSERFDSGFVQLYYNVLK